LHPNQLDQSGTLLQVEKAPWWYVNLLEPYMVQLVRIDFGQSCCGTLRILIQYFSSFDYLSYFIMVTIFFPILEPNL